MALINPNTNGIDTQVKPVYPMNWFYRIICWCSGANISILRQFKTEHDKYFGIGSAVFMTGIFAFISSSYAVSSVFKDKANGQIEYLAVYGFALAWSLFIFSIDRYFVASMSKADSKWLEFATASPRLLIAVFIGLIISNPLELRIFQDEIQDELSTEKQQAVRNVDSIYTNLIKIEEKKRDTVSRAFFTPAGLEVMRYDTLIKNRRNELNRQVKTALDEMVKEGAGTGGSGVSGEGKYFKARKEEVERARKQSQAEIDVLVDEREVKKKEVEKEKGREDSLKNIEITKISDRIRELDSTRIVSKKLKEVQFGTSILAQNHALSTLSEKPGVMGMKWAIVILFILMEISPVLVKLLSKKGVYDEEISKIEYGYDSQNRQDKFLIREELKSNKDLINRMALAQRDLIRKTLIKWKEQRVQKMEENLDDFTHNS